MEYSSRVIPVAKRPNSNTRKGPERSVQKPEKIFPKVLEKEYIPTANPVMKAEAPNDSAYVLIIGNWVNKSKKEKKIIKYMK